MPRQVAELEGEPGCRIRLYALQQFLSFQLEPGMPRDLVLRGQFKEASTQMVPLLEQIRIQKDTLGTRGRRSTTSSSNGSRGCTGPTARRERPQDAVRKGGSQEAVEAAAAAREQVWKSGMRVLGVLVEGGTAETRRAQASTSRACACTSRRSASGRGPTSLAHADPPADADEMKAAQAAAEEAWKDAADWWTSYTQKYPLTPFGIQGRLLLARVREAQGKPDEARAMLEYAAGRVRRDEPHQPPLPGPALEGAVSGPAASVAFAPCTPKSCPTDAEHPDAGVVARAAAVLLGGGLVAFPTETVYGLGANALDAAAVARVFVAKGRPSNNPLIVHVADAGDAARVVAAWPDGRGTAGGALLARPADAGAAEAARVARRGDGRRPDGGGARARPSRRAGADPRGRRAGRRPERQPLRQHFADAGRARLARPRRADRHGPRRAGRCRGGIESTVLDLTRDPPRLLRPGLISPAEIEALVGPIVRPVAQETAAGKSAAVAGDAVAPLRAADAAGVGRRTTALPASRSCGAPGVRGRLGDVRRTGGRRRDGGGDARDAEGYAARLYAALHCA